MKHHLVELETLLHREIVVMDSVEQIVKRLHDGELKEKNNPIFYQKNENYYFLDFTTANNINLSSLSQLELNSVQIPTVKKGSSIEDVICYLEKNDYIIVINNYSNPIGYVKSKEVLLSIYESYKYLNAYFHTMIDTMDASISIVDETGKTVVWTSGAEHLFSIKKDDIINKPMTDFFPEKMLKYKETLKNGTSFYRYQHQPRKDLVVLINTNPVKLNNKIIGVVNAEVDITSQVQLNKELFNAARKISDLEKVMESMTPDSNPFFLIKGKSLPLKKTKEKIKKIGTTKATVLIEGETGVGKELFAKAIHNVRENKDAPFIPINCGAISPTLFESELFGYEKGAFSGALSQGKVGKVELARGGTLFLDEVGELPLDMQVKFLRILQERKYFPVGGTKEIHVDCRIVAATNKDLKKLVSEGTFREDLYYRLNTITINIPPLRERIDDVVEIAHLFLYEFSNSYNRNIESISHNVMQKLMQYHWPGNIRELRNTIEHLVVFATDGVIKEEDLPFNTSSTEEIEASPKSSKSFHSTLTLQQEMDLHEKYVIINTLEKENGNKNAAAKKLGISRASLYNKINKYSIQL